MLQLKAYLPLKVQEVLPDIQDYLLQIQIKNYLTLANILKAIGALSASYVAFKAAKILIARRRYAHLPGPKTNGLIEFFVGNLPSPSQMEKDGKIFPDYLLDWHKQYGPVFKFQILDQIVVATIDPSTIKEALIVKNAPKSTFFFEVLIKPYSVRLLGNGLVTNPDNKSWREQRSIFNPGFHRNALMNYVDEFNSKADILMERLRSLADGKTAFKLADDLNHTTLDAIASVAFGMNLDSINNEKDRIFSSYLAEIIQMAGELFGKPWLKYPPFSWSRARRMRKAVGFLRETGRQKILERLNEGQGSTDQNDILAGILKGTQSNKIDMETMLDNFVTFFGAGQETTANTLSICFLEMGKNKRIFEKCREEVDSVLGTRTEITYEDVSKLKYIGSLFKETLRVYPAGPFIHRFLIEDTSINGYKIPANTHIGFSTYVSGRMESNFPNPLEFKPERFLKDTDSMDTAVPSYAYFPFSIGPRSCIGQNFAQIEAIIILAKFVQRFDFRLAPNQSYQIAFDQTLKPKDGTIVIMSLRQ